MNRSRFSPLTLVLVLALGTLIRLALAWNTTGNYDRESWEIVSRIVSAGGNVYAETDRYNTSPVWFWILGALARFQELFSFFQFRFLFRAFLTLVDLASCWALMSLSGKDVTPRVRTAMLFYLNPVSFLLTGYHGQFDNLAIFFLLIGLAGFACGARGEGFRKGWLWAWTTVGFVTKHIIFYELLIVLQSVFKRGRTRFLLFAASCGLFLLSFLPYGEAGKEGIFQNVFLYASYPMPYGLSALGPHAILTGAFVAALFVYPFFIRKRDLLSQALLGTLFFLVFTTGVGVQYFVLPIALGALKPSRGFFIYSTVTSCHLLGSYFNLGLPVFSWVPLWSVWVAAAYWWVTESLVHPKAAQPA